MGRNFANKLWNAARLVLLAAEGVEAKRSTVDQVDRWIESRLQLCVSGLSGELAEYDFAAAVDTLYHFVWDEFCDWYLEMVKVRLYGDDEAARGEAAGHARHVLEAIVRLLHPIMPFVTEEIAAQYGQSPLLERAYPESDPAAVSAADEAAIGRLQAAVNAVRAYRAETRTAPGVVVRAWFVADGASGEEAAETYRAYAAVFASLARTELSFDAVDEAGTNVVIVPGGRLEIAAPAVDTTAEVARLRAQLDKLADEIGRAQQKLTNPAFVERAPAAVVAKEREKLAGHEASRDELLARIARLSPL
jgi:valyl-tRNA synthetase